MDPIPKATERSRTGRVLSAFGAAVLVLSLGIGACGSSGDGSDTPSDVEVETTAPSGPGGIIDESRETVDELNEREQQIEDAEEQMYGN